MAAAHVANAAARQRAEEKENRMAKRERERTRIERNKEYKIAGR